MKGGRHDEKGRTLDLDVEHMTDGTAILIGVDTASCLLNADFCIFTLYYDESQIFHLPLEQFQFSFSNNRLKCLTKQTGWIP